MDTKKALIVIMVLLVIMNVALASYIIVISTGRDTKSGINDYAVEILRQRNIELGCKIPEEGPGASVITLAEMLYSENSFENLIAATGGSYSIDSAGRLIFIKAPDENANPTEMNRTAVETKANDFMVSIGLQRDDFVLDVLNISGMDEYDVRYIEKDSSGILYYNSYIEMKITEFGVVYAEIYIRTVRDKDEGGAGILPIQTIMLANLTVETKTMTIDDISFGYYQKDRASDEAIMSWRVHFDNGSERFFDVGNGREITQELDILEFNNILFDCSLPAVYYFRGPVVFGDSNYTLEKLNTMPVFMNGRAEIDSSDIVNYIRTSYDSTRYNLNNETAVQIAEGFIEDIGLSTQEHYLDRMVVADDGSYDMFYIMSDVNNALYFDNFININIKEQGVAYASLRHRIIGVGLNQTEPMAVGAVLLDNLDTENGKVYTVTEIMAGYKLDSEDSVNATPCWRIVFKDGRVRYFSAENGEELAQGE